MGVKADLSPRKEAFKDFKAKLIGTNGETRNVVHSLLQPLFWSSVEHEQALTASLMVMNGIVVSGRTRTGVGFAFCRGMKHLRTKVRGPAAGNGLGGNQPREPDASKVHPTPLGKAASC